MLYQTLFSSTVVYILFAYVHIANLLVFLNLVLHFGRITFWAICNPCFTYNVLWNLRDRIFTPHFFIASTGSKYETCCIQEVAKSFVTSGHHDEHKMQLADKLHFKCSIKNRRDWTKQNFVFLHASKAFVLIVPAHFLLKLKYNCSNYILFSSYVLPNTLFSVNMFTTLNPKIVSKSCLTNNHETNATSFN